MSRRTTCWVLPCICLQLAVGQFAQAEDRQSKESEVAAVDSGSDFAAPVRLMVGKIPMNSDVKQMYPSPAVYDVDADGKDELVVGDIFGALHVYENENKDGKGDPVWGKPERLKMADGEAIKVSNW